MAGWNYTQWSKIKKRVKVFVCPALRRRIDFHFTGYRHAHDGVGEVWITVDGKKVHGGGYLHYLCSSMGENATLKICAPGFLGLPADERAAVGREAASFRAKNEVHDSVEFIDAFKEYPRISIRRALACQNPIIRAFAMIDRRAGKRTIESLRVSPSEHSLVKLFHSLRVESFHKQPKRSTAAS